MKISIIILGENVKKSVKGILKQSLDDIEIFCVGNQDGNDSIKKSPSIDNALSESAGEYICILNYDDILVDENDLESSYEYCMKNDVDVALFDDESAVINKHDYKKELFSKRGLFKKEFIMDNSFECLDSNDYNLFLAQVLGNADEIHLLSANIAINDFDGLLDSYKLMLIHLSEDKYYKVCHEFRELILDFIESRDAGNLSDVMDSLTEKFHDFPYVLNNFKEFIYFKFKDHADFNGIVELKSDLNNPRISVIIPVYNARDFLDESISSLLNQTFEDFELVCVNDGSKDNSLEILNDFAKKDSRVKVFDKENGGCGSARNRALDEARGKYIYFFDPDDKIPENTFEETYKSAVYNDSDMVIFKANIFDDEHGISNDEIFFKLYRSLKQKNYERFSFDYHDVEDFVLGGGFAPWAKLYRKEFLDSYTDFRFDVGIAFDDVPFHVKSMLRAKRLSYVNKFLYHYRVDNVNSVNSTASNGFDIFKIIDIIKDFLISEGYFDEFEKKFYRLEVNHIMLYIISTDSEEYYKIARERFLKIDEDLIIPANREKYDLVVSIEDYEEFKSQYSIYLLEKDIKRLKKEVSKLEKENRKLRKEHKEISNLNNELQSSKSWKITKPLRKLRKL